MLERQKEERDSKIIELNQIHQKELEKEKQIQREFIEYIAIIGSALVIGSLILLILMIIRIKRKSRKDINEFKAKIKLQQDELSSVHEELHQKYDEIKTINLELNKQNAIIEERNAVLEAQNEEIVTQRDLLSVKNMAISDSINYAMRIQTAVMPQIEYINEILPDYFILFKPRDIVSGDFYWIRQINYEVVIVVADCTGHGIPAAILSMLGISYLNEIVKQKEITQPNKILNEMRKQLKYTLKKPGRDGGIDDGLDISVCTLNKKTKLLQFSGANNSLYLIQNGEPREIHADKMPIGFYLNEKASFTNHEIQLLDDDLFFLYTDGYIDQFGGQNGSKFKSINFKRILNENYSKPIEVIKEHLDSELHNWMKGYDQTDDILVMGVRV